MFIELLATFTVLILLCFKIRSYYWINRNVPGPKPWPFVGNIAEHVFARKTLGQVIHEIYNNFEGYPFVGIFRALTPCLLVRDPELAQQIFVKKQEAFYNNDFFLDKNYEPLIKFNPFLLRDQDWKESRQLLNPGFSSSKMKQMYPIIDKVSDQLIPFIENHKNNIIEIKDFSKRYITEMVARAAFGIDGHALENPDDYPEFLKDVDAILKPGFFTTILIQINAVAPFLGKLIRLKIVPKRIEDKFIKIVTEVIKYRRENQSNINDYLQFAHQTEKQGLSSEGIVAHGVTFILGGYENFAVAFVAFLLDIAKNPKYQDKIRQEIKQMEFEHGTIGYEVLGEMKWLDACLNESMRVTPGIDVLVKCCTQPFEYTSTNPDYKKISVKLYPGDTVIVPISSLWKDEKYFEKANEFLPERMLNKYSAKFRFSPFGIGPRICLAKKFSLMGLKLGIVKILKNYELSINSKTKFPLKLNPIHFTNVFKDNIYIDFKRLN